MTTSKDESDNANVADAKTLLSPRPTAEVSAAPSAALYTQFTQGGHNHTSSGFAQAQAIAQGADAGQLLKKRFLLERVLGQGGMGTVYKTKDLRKVEAEDPNPYIATKVLNSAFKDHPDAFVALQQEAAKSHALAHPNIVTVHDFDRDGDILFMTMELLQGDPLDDLLRRYAQQPFNKPQALRMVQDLCAALAYAHQRHIIHADFKPGNVFVCDDGTTKVLDFGIARAASKETQKHKFDAGQLGALTPAYATIEMVRDQALTFSDDVYALGCVAYEIFTGRHPYGSVSALEAKQRGLKLQPVASLNRREWAALSHALSLDRNTRTPTINAFMAQMFPRSNSLMLSVAIGFACVALGGAAWFGVSQHKAKLQLQHTIADNLAQAQTCFAQSDFACALEHSLVAVNLDENNAAAQQLVSASQLAQQVQQNAQQIETLLQDADACLASQDDACAEVKAKDVLALDANNARAKALLSAAKDLDKSQAIAENIAQATSCLEKNDSVCALLFAKKAEEISPSHPRVQALLNQLANREQQGKLAQQAQQEKVSSLVAVARECLTQKKYTCAMTQADAALAIDSANGQAMEVKQTAAVADKQIRESQEKVTRILTQAKECLEQQKNYSCAIAKAEAALDVMPNNADALAIKKRAQDTQRKIKETGFTIK